jgi:23S rRNA (cytosine1962-C5)-methyltransferase
MPTLPLICFEDEHLLVVNKPAGMNTHAPSPFAGEGLYDWLRHREPRWTRLAIIHRLDKETSGVMVFAKTPLANRSLGDQFTRRTVRKKYLLATDRKVGRKDFTVVSAVARLGEKYVSRPLHAGGDAAKTRFHVLETSDEMTILKAEPATGRTHQIRVHAADHGFPILGDILYGGTTAPRLYLHSVELAFAHPLTGTKLTFNADPDFRLKQRFQAEAGRLLRALNLRGGFVDPIETNAYRMIHGAADGCPGWYVDRLGDYLLSQAEQPLPPDRLQLLEELLRRKLRGAYHKVLSRSVRRATMTEVSAHRMLAEAAPERFLIRENGVKFELSFDEGYSVGLFLDQRDNRRRFLVNHVAADFALFPGMAANAEVLNTFAYTCGFSVCAAKTGARTTSIDLSKKYLDWGRRNFALNQIDPARHDFIYGDVFQWLRRLAQKKRLFDVIVLDPPTFSQSKQAGVFRAEKDYGCLARATLPLLKPNGILFASTNAAEWKPEEFLEAVEAPIHSAKRRILQRHYVPQPPDFPISRAEPAYLKTVWLRVSG